MIARDVPHHHTVEIFADLARAQAGLSTDSKIWAQDLNGAYRQFPVKNPDDCFCALLTPEGPVILRHHALMFGAAGSVWSFNRAADGIMFISRRLLALPLGHFVDDFIAIEPDMFANSGFEEFARMARTLGLRMKESKALAPSSTQKILGIQMEINDNEVILRPHQDRSNKVLAVIHTALSSNKLTADDAQQLAGKVNVATGLRQGPWSFSWQ